MNQLTPAAALNFLDQATSTMEGNRAQHQTIIQSVMVLRQFIAQHSPKPEEVKPPTQIKGKKPVASAGNGPTVVGKKSTAEKTAEA